MCGRKELFVEMDENNVGNMKFGDLSKYLLTAKKKIIFRSKSGEEEFTSNVYYVPELQSNILSMDNYWRNDILFI